MNRLLLSVLGLLVVPLLAQARMLSGRILDAATQKPLVGVTVFLEGSTLKSMTDGDGNFLLACSDNTHGLLIASHLGYTTQAVSTNLFIPGENRVISLRPRSYNLATATIKVKGKKDPNRAYYLKLFTDSFLGVSEASKSCTILNLDAVRFKTKTNNGLNRFTLLATADTVLIVQNKRLGYEMHYTLIQFSWSKTSSSFYGFPLFIDNIQTYPDSSRIRSEREKAYRGSSMHFFRSLYNQSLLQEGFRVFIASNDSSGGIAPYNLRDLTEKKGIQAACYLNTPILIRYIKDGEEAYYISHTRNFGGLRSIKDQQSSYVKPSGSPIVFYPDGTLKDPSQLQISGYWSYRLAADWLPIDFQPKDSTQAP
jgi:hypothetical protein